MEMLAVLDMATFLLELHMCMHKWPIAGARNFSSMSW